jgi:hypothetical protein
MSAFVISPETMSRAVRAICARNSYGQIIPTFAGVDTSAKNACTLIGRRLFTLNVEAVMQRYPDDNASEYAYTETFELLTPNNPAMHRGKALIAGYKALGSLAYQCSEGDVPQTDLYRELRTAMGAIAEQIVTNLPEYEAAPHGS